LINWITKTELFDEPNEMRSVLVSIFGRREMLNNKRVVNTLMIIAKEVLRAELDLTNLKDMTSPFLSDSPFKTLFNLIFECQTQNMNFVRGVLTHIMMILCRKNVPVHQIKIETLSFIEMQLKEGFKQFHQT